MAVTLAKGQAVSLAKSDGGQLTRAHMGLGWDAGRGFLGRPRAVDLDASCMVFDRDGTLVDQVWFRQLRSKDGAIQHTGDNLTGRGEGDDESILVDLDRVDPVAWTLVFVVNSFSGETFAKIENAYCRLVDRDSDAELARYSLSGSGSHTAQIMAKLQRSADGGGWTMTALGSMCRGKTFKDLVPEATRLL